VALEDETLLKRRKEEGMVGETPGSRGDARGTAEVRARMTTGLGAESWQWLAFLFAAAVTLVFAFVDNFVDGKVLKAALYIVLFVGLFYLFLVNRPFRVWARAQLERIRWDTR